MKRIDDIFKKGLDNKGLDYSEAHWNEMETLLDKNKKGGFFYHYKWALMGLVLLASVALTYSVIENLENRPLAQMDTSSEAPKELEAAPNLNGTETPTITIETRNTPKPIALAKPMVIENNTETKAVKLKSYKEGLKNKTLSTNSTPISRNTSMKESEVLNYSKMPDLLKKERTKILDLQSRKEAIKFKEKGAQEEWKVPMQILLARPSFLPLNIEKEQAFLLDQNVQFKGLKLPWAHYLSVYTEYNMAQATSFQGSLETKNTEEAFVNTMGYGIQWMAKKNQFAFKAGLGYHSIQQETNYSSTERKEYYDTSLQLIKRNYGMDGRGKWFGLIEETVDTTVVESSRVDCPDCKVQFQYVSVPLAAQYEAQWKSVTLFGEIGFKTSFLTNASGTYSKYSGMGLTRERLATSQDAQKVLFSTSLAAGLKVPLTYRTQLWASYGVSKNLNSRVKSYKQNDGFQSLQLGLEFRL